MFEILTVVVTMVDFLIIPIAALAKLRRKKTTKNGENKVKLYTCLCCLVSFINQHFGDSCLSDIKDDDLLPTLKMMIFSSQHALFLICPDANFFNFA